MTVVPPQLALSKPSAQRPGFWFACYQLGWHILLPFVLLRLWWRGRKDSGYRQSIAERFGFSKGIRPGAIWIHAVSVGETRAAQPLIESYLAQGKWVLLTCMTPNGRRTGADLYAKAIAEGRLQQTYLPYDLCWSVEYFLKRTQPALGLFMETEAWPTIIFRCAELQLPVFLINARLSERSARRVSRFGTAGRALFQAFAGILAQTELDAQRYRSLGVQHCEVVGNLKFDVAQDPRLIEQGIAWHEYLQSRKRLMVCAASTREGEEELILQAWNMVLAQQVHDPRLIKPLLCIVPRHPERFSAVASAIESHGLSLVRRSALDSKEWDKDAKLLADIDVVLGDSMGEMPLYYNASDLVVMGGSLMPLGGQNLIEACAAACPVLLGEHTFNFQQASIDAVEAGAALRVKADSALVPNLANAIQDLLRDSAQRERMAQAAIDYAARHQGATQKITAALDRFTA